MKSGCDQSRGHVRNTALFRADRAGMLGFMRHKLTQQEKEDYSLVEADRVLLGFWGTIRVTVARDKRGLHGLLFVISSPRFHLGGTFPHVEVDATGPYTHRRGRLTPML